MIEKKYMLTVEDESIADENAIRQVIQTARYHGFEVSDHVERTCRIEEFDLDGNPVGETVFGDGFCSSCWGIIDFEDKFCRWCGAMMEER